MVRFRQLRRESSAIQLEPIAVASSSYKLTPLRDGTQSVYSVEYEEQMHPGLGPSAEAEHLHVAQAKIRSRLQNHSGEFVVWDVGLGAAANALTLLRLTRDLSASLHVVSFDNNVGPLSFALHNADRLEYLSGYQSTVKAMIERHRAELEDGAHNVNWELHLADFPSLIASSDAASLPKPHAILFDPFSPAKNPAMWTLGVFENLYKVLDPARSCVLTTYSRSTVVRVSLLISGFFVGRGRPTGLKEETTVAANALDLLGEPLDKSWLETVRKSQSAEPLTSPQYRQSALSPQTWERLQRCAQFA